MIIVENGTGISGAEAYSSVAFTDAYWLARPQFALATTWAAASTPDKEGAKRASTAYLDAVFGAYYRGTRTGYVQGREWPRTGALDGSGYPLPNLPLELQNADCELAARALTAPLAGDAARGGNVKTNKVGDISQEFFENSQRETEYGIVTKMLGPILNGQQSGMPQWIWR